MCIQDLSKNNQSFHKRLEKEKKNTHTTHTPAHHPHTGTNAAYTSTPAPSSTQFLIFGAPVDSELKIHR